MLEKHEQMKVPSGFNSNTLKSGSGQSHLNNKKKSEQTENHITWLGPSKN